MGALGLMLVAVGAVTFAVAQRRLEAVLAALPESLSREADARVGRINRFAIVVAVAVAIYLVARQFRHGREGLYVCVAMLIVNAAIVATLRTRWLDELGPSPNVSRAHRIASWAQAVGAAIGFIGCAVYLLR